MSAVISTSFQRDLFRALLIGFVYFLLARASLLFVVEPSHIAVIWPASGFALAMLLLTERRSWPLTLAAIFTAVALANLLGENSLAVSLGFAFANCLESLSAAFFIQYFIGASISFTKIREVALFALVAVIASNALTAFVGAAVPALGEDAPYWTVWLTWFIEDGVGMCLLTPLLVSWSFEWRSVFKWGGWLRVLEFSALLLVIMIVTVVSFGSVNPFVAIIVRPYLVFPLLMLAAFRFACPSVTLLFLLHSLVVFWLSKTGVGWFSFSGDNSHQLSLISLQAYFGVTSLVTLMVSALNAEHRLARKTLEHSRRFLLQAQQVANLGVYELDITSGIWTSSGILDRIFGIDKAFVRTVEAWGSLIHPEDREWMLDYFCNEVLGKRQSFDHKYRIIRRNDGVERWVHGLGELEFNGGSYPVRMIGTIQDITDSKQAEVALVTAKKRADEAASSKAKFLDIAAHELRNPVTAISLILQVIEKQMENGQHVTVNALARLRAPTDRLIRLVVDLLDVSRLERGLLVLKLVHTDLVSLISTCVDEFRVLAPTRRLVFSKPNCPIESDVDPVRINQVLSNFLDNAVKYTPEDSVIEIVAELKPDSIRVSVTDHGAGISKEHQDSIFSGFTRGSSDAVVRAGGLGLGLAVSRGIIELHKGTIGVESEEGQGSTFFFELSRKFA